ncbi:MULTISPECIES: hypothetical protein [Halorussus]|uniref:hypothetical protein n=1 Tax=Halorussus TaxID=1070314 RepID=UPI00209ECE12|nr:hypothetical protein [Halorussus vallis]USZ78043.1 hypothetical protein NGM07_20485 [Halorussus vallis]
MAKDPYTDDEYDDTYREVHGDEPVRDRYAEDATDDTFFPSGGGGWAGRFAPSGWGIWPVGSTADTDRPEYDDTVESDEYASNEYAADEDDEGSWWDEGLIGTIIVAGFVLFIIPEPATSALGIFLMGLGVVLWIVDWLL